MKRNVHFHTISLLILLGPLFLFLSSCKGGGYVPIYNIIPSEQTPAASIGISAVAGDKTVTIGWSSVASAVSYDIYRSLMSGQTGTKIASVTSSASYTDTNLENETTFFYTVAALDKSGDASFTSQVFATPTATPGPITVSGFVQYQDKEYDLDGFTGIQPYKKVRYATVELVSGDTVLHTAVTDSHGYYSISASTTTSVYVRVTAEAILPGASTHVLVNDMRGDPYSAGGNDVVVSGPANVNLTIPASSIAGAFNILDTLTSGVQFIYSLSGSYPATDLSAYWKPNNAKGTYYCTGGCSPGDGIYVYSDPSRDTDEYDDDILYHEFGHFAADKFSKDDSLGGLHRLTDDDLDMRLSWSEGWGDAFPGAIKMWLNATAPDLLSSKTGMDMPLTAYVDTSTYGAGIAIDMGDPDGSYEFNYYYASSEIAIAKILLDLSKNFSMQDIWDVITSAHFKAQSPRVNLEAFWNSWFATGKAGTSELEEIFRLRKIFYSQDQNEDNNTHITATPIAIGASLTNTLYSVGDTDFFSFNADEDQSFTITTSNLMNGADTYMTLYNANLDPVPGPLPNLNDNWNPEYSYSSGQVPSDFTRSICESLRGFPSYSGPCHENADDVLGSRIRFTAEMAGVYYIEIKSSPTAPVSAGRYGTYSIGITLTP